MGGDGFWGCIALCAVVVVGLASLSFCAIQETTADSALVYGEIIQIEEEYESFLREGDVVSADKVLQEACQDLSARVSDGRIAMEPSVALVRRFSAKRCTSNL